MKKDSESSSGRSVVKEKKKPGLILDVDEERDPARAGALHTLYKLDQSPDHDIADLVPEGEIKSIKRDKEGKLIELKLHYDPDKNLPDEAVERTKAMNEKFNALSRKLWDTLITHGYAKEQEDGTFKMVKEISDLDGESCLTLCRLAGLDTSKVKYIPQGEGGDEEGLIMDTSETDGIVAQEGGKRVIMDHHGKESDRSTSATKHVYNFLIENGLLKKQDYLDKFVEFVTEEDNKTYFESDLRKNFKNSWRTLRGLNYYISPEEIIRLFENGTDPDESLEEGYLKSYKCKDNGRGDAAMGKSLKEIGQDRKKAIEQSERAIHYLEKSGFVFDTGNDNYGRVLVDVGVKIGKKRKRNVSMGHDAVRAAGYGGYLVWNPEEHSFVLYTTKPLRSNLYPEKEIRFSQGFNIRGNMWMKVRDREPLQVTMEEIVSKLSRKKVDVPEDLEKALKKEKFEIKAPEPEKKDSLKDKEETKKEKAIGRERWRQINDAIENYSKHGKRIMRLFGKGGQFEIKGKDENDTKNKLNGKVEEFVRERVKNFDGGSVGIKKFDEDEIEYIVKNSLEKIFSNKK